MFQSGGGDYSSDFYFLQTYEQIISDLSLSNSLLGSFCVLFGQTIIFFFQFLQFFLQCCFVLGSILLKPAQSEESWTGHLEFFQSIRLQLFSDIPQSLLPVDKLQWIILTENDKVQ